MHTIKHANRFRKREVAFALFPVPVRMSAGRLQQGHEQMMWIDTNAQEAVKHT
jgi:hypothetical protein